jgi:hypothetical protein
MQFAKERKPRKPGCAFAKYIFPKTYSHGQPMSTPLVQDGGKQIHPMTKKEQFMAFVLVGATARDINADTNDSQLILHTASQIPEDAIPENIMNAAKVFLAFCQYAGKRPYRWMLPEKAEG